MNAKVGQYSFFAGVILALVAGLIANMVNAAVVTLGCAWVNSRIYEYYSKGNNWVSRRKHSTYDSRVCKHDNHTMDRQLP